LHGRPQGTASSFKFGMAYGQALGVVQGLLFPYQTVSAAKWKRHMSLTSDKEYSRRRAIECFPKFADQFSRKMDEGRAEAALLALSARRNIAAPEIAGIGVGLEV